MQEARVFIVHLWSAGEQADFRAAVHRTGTDESAWFTQAGALANYFRQQTRASTDGDCAEREEQS